MNGQRFTLLYAAAANGFIFRKKILLNFQRFDKELLLDKELLDLFCKWNRNCVKSGTSFPPKLICSYRHNTSRHAFLIRWLTLSISYSIKCKFNPEGAWVCKMVIVIKWCTICLFIYFLFFLFSEWVIGCKRFEHRVLKLWAKLAIVSSS